MSSKRTVIERMRSNAGMTTAEADRALAMTFLALREVLESPSESDTAVTIPGFGTFRRKFVDTRGHRNPKTGEPVTVAAHYKISFREPKDKR